MKLESIKSKSKKRLGRGISAGQGKTAGRGTKGQKARAGYNLPSRFEGGQTSLGMRLPKLPGFKSHRTKSSVISLDTIAKSFSAGETISTESLIKKGLARPGEKVKILNNGKFSVNLSLAEDVAASSAARELFEKGKPAKAEVPNQKMPAQTAMKSSKRSQ